MIKTSQEIKELEQARIKNLCLQAERQFRVYEEAGTPEERKQAHHQWQTYELIYNAICEL